MQTGPKRTAQQRTADRAAIAQMWLRCMTQAEIAEQKLPSGAKLTQQMVSVEVRAIEREWKTHTITDFDQAKRREYEKMNQVERDAWQGWERSKADLKAKRAKISKSDGESKDEAATETKNQVGEVRFLEVLIKASESRRKLYGLDARTEILNNSSNVQIYLPDNGRNDSNTAPAGAGEVPVQQS